MPSVRSIPKRLKQNSKWRRVHGGGSPARRKAGAHACLGWLPWPWCSSRLWRRRSGAGNLWSLRSRTPRPKSSRQRRCSKRESRPRQRLRAHLRLSGRAVRHLRAPQRQRFLPLLHLLRYRQRLCRSRRRCRYPQRIRPRWPPRQRQRRRQRRKKRRRRTRRSPQCPCAKVWTLRRSPHCLPCLRYPRSLRQTSLASRLHRHLRLRPRFARRPRSRQPSRRFLNGPA